MNVLFRVDASVHVGTGHVMRCLTLAHQLTAHGASVSFCCARQEGDMIEAISRAGFPVLPIEVGSPWDSWDWEADALATLAAAGGPSRRFDWLIVDHYGLDRKWEEATAALCLRQMVIDDLADRPHSCNLLLDQNYYPDAQARYSGLVPASCEMLCGPRYVLLRPDFIVRRQSGLRRTGRIESVLLSFGGSDPGDLTSLALDACEMLDSQPRRIDVVVGASNPRAAALKDRCKAFPNVSYHQQTPHMAELLSKTDLAVGAGGSSMWERCYLGLPSITVISAENQRETTEAVAETGAIFLLGEAARLQATDYRNAIDFLAANREAVESLTERSFALMGPASEPGPELVERSLRKSQGR